MTVTANAGTTDDAGVLRIDSLSFYGNRIAMMTQYLEVSVSNSSNDTYEGHWYLLARDVNTGSRTLCLDTLMTLPAQSFYMKRLYCQLPEGDLELLLTTDAEGLSLLGSCNVTIGPLRKLDFQATFSLDMLTEADGEQVLFGSRIRGWVRVENYDTPYYGVHGGAGDDDGIVLWLEDRDSGERLFTKHIANKIEFWDRAESSFSYDAMFRDGAHYALKTGYGMPYGLELIDSLCFTTRTGTNTYWTAQGQVLPLPLSGNLQSGDNLQLTVPAEAVAVDLRGQQTINTVFTIDVSQANPNCLYYLDLSGNVPQGLDESRNLVRGLKAEHVKLTEGYDYFCPLAFNAQFISFLMTPSYDNPDDDLRGRGYSETIVLPFYPSQVNLYDINGEAGRLYKSRHSTLSEDSIDGSAGEMLHADMLTILRYYGNEGDSLNIVRLSSLSQMQAYEPYILGVYIGSRLLFIGENTQVPMTREAIIHGQNINFVGTTVARQLPSPTYQYNADDNRFYPSTARIAPFRAYMDDSTGAFDYLFFSDEVWGSNGKPSDATAISELPQREDSPTMLPVYSLSGQRISEHLTLRPGIYIVGGRKVIVR